MWVQKTIRLKRRSRGYHLISDEIIKSIPEIREIKTGLCHIFIQHTSASLTLNENADPSVREDFERHFNKTVPENQPYYTHTLEGSDDMPAHLKASILGSSVTVPVAEGRFNVGTWQGVYLEGRFNVGTWQGVYLCEHRDHGGERKIVVTLMGERRP